MTCTESDRERADVSIINSCTWEDRILRIKNNALVLKPTEDGCLRLSTVRVWQAAVTNADSNSCALHFSRPASKVSHNPQLLF